MQYYIIIIHIINVTLLHILLFLDIKSFIIVPYLFITYKIGKKEIGSKGHQTKTYTMKSTICMKGKKFLPLVTLLGDLNPLPESIPSTCVGGLQCHSR